MALSTVGMLKLAFFNGEAENFTSQAQQNEIGHLVTVGKNLAVSRDNFKIGAAVVVTAVALMILNTMFYIFALIGLGVCVAHGKDIYDHVNHIDKKVEHSFLKSLGLHKV